MRRQETSDRHLSTLIEGAVCNNHDARSSHQKKNMCMDENRGTIQEFEGAATQRWLPDPSGRISYCKEVP